MDLPFTPANLFVHGSNLILLLAYTTRDMMWLRVLALAAAVTIIPYYFIQPSVLWPPLLWSLVYAVVHAYHIAFLVRQRRPVTLTADERRLRELSFPSLQPYEFLQLLRLGEWAEVAEGTPFDLGRDTMVLLAEGRVEASAGGTPLGELTPGQLIGVSFMLEGEPDWLHLRAATAVRVVRWSRARLEAEMKRSPHIGAACASLLNHDLASKLIRLAGEFKSAKPSA